MSEIILVAGTGIVYMIKTGQGLQAKVQWLSDARGNSIRGV